MKRGDFVEFLDGKWAVVNLDMVGNSQYTIELAPVDEWDAVNVPEPELAMVSEIGDTGVFCVDGIEYSMESVTRYSCNMERRRSDDLTE